MKCQVSYAAVTKLSKTQQLVREREMGVGWGFSLVHDVIGWVVSSPVAAFVPDESGPGSPAPPLKCFSPEAMHVFSAHVHQPEQVLTMGNSWEVGSEPHPHRGWGRCWRVSRSHTQPQGPAGNVPALQENEGRGPPRQGTPALQGILSDSPSFLSSQHQHGSVRIYIFNSY